MSEITGGGYQYPKAVLDAVGKRYLVEHTEGTNDNGTWWADRYSDGWVEQGGRINSGTSGGTLITLPIAFSNINYYANYIAEREGVNPYDDVYLQVIQEKSTTSFRAKDYMISSRPFVWEAKGFAA